MKRNGHNDEYIKIAANTNTLKSVLEIQDDYRVDFRVQNSISSVLGFRNQVQGRTQVGGLGLNPPP